MPKPITIIFCGRNPQFGTDLAAKLRTGLNTVQLAAASRYIDFPQQCERVIIMPDVEMRSREAVKRVYPKAEDYQFKIEQPVKNEEPTPIRKRRGRPPKIRLVQE